MNAQTPQFRHVYTCEQFASEIMCGARKADWVRDEIKRRHIKPLPGKPYLISSAEVIRFLQFPKS